MTKQMSLLPELPLQLKYPKKGTLADLALKQMLSGKRISHLTFLHSSAESYCLRAAIFELRKLGWPVEIMDKARITKKKQLRRIRYYYACSKVFPTTAIKYLSSIMGQYS